MDDGGGFIEGSAGLGSVSRRSFLSVAGTAAALRSVSLVQSAGLPVEEGRNNRPDLNALVLTLDDLLVPADGGYVHWHVDPTDTPLIHALQSSIDKFTTVPTAVSAFIAHGESTQTPAVIESAAFKLDEQVSFSTMVIAIDTWLHRTYLVADEGPSIVMERTESGVQWSINLPNGWQDVLQLEAVGSVVLFTAAYGKDKATIAPQVAVNRYANITTNRANARV